jgi:hypothetical protein
LEKAVDGLAFFVFLAQFGEGGETLHNTDGSVDKFALNKVLRSCEWVLNDYD